LVPSLLGHSEHSTNAYIDANRRIIKSLPNSSAIKFYTAKDVFPESNLAPLRDRFIDVYGEPIDKIKEMVKKDSSLEKTRLGLVKFYEHIYHHLITCGRLSISKTQASKEAKAHSYRLIQNRDMWERLGNTWFPDGLRASYTLGTPTINKFPLLMGTVLDRWGTPWHSTGVNGAVGTKNNGSYGRLILGPYHVANKLGFVEEQTPEGYTFMNFPKSVSGNIPQQRQMIQLFRQVRPGGPKIEDLMQQSDYKRPDLN
jgi:pyoverdine/dityrosine biosynthesis protein Dit1